MPEPSEALPSSCIRACMSPASSMHIGFKRSSLFERASFIFCKSFSNPLVSMFTVAIELILPKGCTQYNNHPLHQVLFLKRLLLTESHTEPDSNLLTDCTFERLP